LRALRKEEIKFYESTQLGLGESADYFRDRDKHHGSPQLKVPAVIQPQMDNDAAVSAPPTYGEPTEALDIDPG